MNPIPEEAGGDLYLVNGNMLPVSLVGSKKEGGENLNRQTEKQAGANQRSWRELTVSMTELRVLSEGDEEATKPIIEGHAAAFNQW